MNRRNFLKVSGMGTIMLLLSGCGWLGLADGNSKANAVMEKGSVSGGRKMNLLPFIWRTDLLRERKVQGMKYLPLMQPMRKHIPVRDVTNVVWMVPVSSRMPLKTH
jgi:hypothetical protein